MGFEFFIIFMFLDRILDVFLQFIRENLDQVLDLNMQDTPSPINANHGYKVMYSLI